MPEAKETTSNQEKPGNKEKGRSGAWFWFVLYAIVVGAGLFVGSWYFTKGADRATFLVSGILSASVLSVVIVQAVIYHRQWGVMERTLIFSERAFVYAKEAIIVGGRNVPDRPRPTYPAFIAVTIENTGNTPARNLTVDANACAIPAELPPDFSYPSFAKTPGSPTLIGPRAGSQITLPIEDAILGDVYARRRNLFVYGTVLYVDIFGRARQTQFCFRYNGFSLGKDGNIDKTIFGPGEGHNCDDENCPEKWGDNDAGLSGPK